MESPGDSSLVMEAPPTSLIEEVEHSSGRLEASLLIFKWETDIHVYSSIMWGK